MEDNSKIWELITAKVNNELSEEESAELDSVLKDENTGKLYGIISSLKRDLESVRSLKNFSQKNSWKKVSGRIRRKNFRLVLTIIKYAAIVVFAFLIGKFVSDTYGQVKKPMGTTELDVPLGQMSEIKLKDGTSVWLNSGTSLKYDDAFGMNERRVYMEGEGFFDVAKNDIPFRVELRNLEVEVLGTSFNIISYADESYSRVVLVSGKLNVNNQSGLKLADLQPSEQIYIDDVSRTFTKGNVDTEFFTSWTEGKIVFKNEKLSDISKKLERWYNADIQFGDDSVGDFRFSGTILKHKPFNQVVTAFELRLPIKINYTSIPNGKDKIVITKIKRLCNNELETKTAG